MLVMAEFNPDAIAKPVLKGPSRRAPQGRQGRQSEKRRQGRAQERREGRRQRRDGQDPRQGRQGRCGRQGRQGRGCQEGRSQEGAAETRPQGRAQRIEKENQRRREEYEGKIAQGKKHVQELNNRFADWYYVISDDVYRKIHVGREQVVKKKDKKDAHGKGDHGGPSITIMTTTITATARPTTMTTSPIRSEI